MKKQSDEKGAPFAMIQDRHLYSAKVFVNICYLQNLAVRQVVAKVKKQKKTKIYRKIQKWVWMDPRRVGAFPEVSGPMAEDREEIA